jgi:uncharacterized protein DUF2786
MGKNNKARRAAKARTRTKARAGSANPGRSGGWAPDPPDPGPTPEEVATSLWVAAAGERLEGGYSRSEQRLSTLPWHQVLLAAESLVLQDIGVLWANGWQPAELLRQGRIGTPSATCARLVARAIAGDHARRRATTLDSAWVAQVEGLGLPPEDGGRGWLLRWVEGQGLTRAQAVETVLATLVCLFGVPPLQPLMPMPGPPGGRPIPVASQARRGAVRDPVLDRVRNLLAKAESTTFEAEATALTAKAQQLITRHAIDVALLEGRSSRRSTPVEVRIPVDAPYSDAKSLLLQTVAEAGRCRAVFEPRVQLSTVVGFAGDVEAVEVLFTSLLVQAQSALGEASRNAPPGARTRRSSYRATFLVAFAHRIGHRLREINSEVLSEAEHERGRSVLPVLADRSAAVEDYVSERFGHLVEGSVRGGMDAAGWAGGRLAADRARLSFGELSEDLADSG